MKVSTEINTLAKLVGEKKAIEYYAKVGFDAWDFSLFNMAKIDWQNLKVLPSDHPLAGKNYLKFAKELKQVALDNGIECNQSHAPFPIYIKEVQDMLKKAIECTAEVGAKICVIHPDNYKSASENAKIFNELLPFAKEHNVMIATENMWDWDNEKDQAKFSACSNEQDFLAHLNAVHDDNFVACLDIGHAEMKGLNTSSVKMIYALKDKLKALHIHDNDLKNDSHQIPFSMKIDFSAIVKALKDIRYDGYFTLEADQYLKIYDADNALTGAENLYKAIRKLADEFERV